MKIKIIVIFIAGLFIASCSDADSEQPAKGQDVGSETAKTSNPFSTPPAPKREIDPKQLAQGEKLFLKNCAKCHGENGEGHPKWQEKGEDGKYPPPPVNGEGHAWHHPTKILRDYIKLGSMEKGGNMEGFKDTLGDGEVDDIIAWFKSKWPDQQYTSWYWRDQESKGKEDG
ncbi:MAG: c-type cytochrome [Nitrospinota bacterium]